MTRQVVDAVKYEGGNYRLSLSPGTGIGGSRFVRLRTEWRVDSRLSIVLGQLFRFQWRVVS